MAKITFLLTVFSALIFGNYLNAASSNELIGQFDKSWDTSHSNFVLHAIPKCGVHQSWRLCHLLTPQERIVSARFDGQSLKKTDQRNGIGFTIEAFTSEGLDKIQKSNFKMIAIIRDPRDALISHVHYMRLFAEKPNPQRLRDFFTVGADFDFISLDEQIKSLIVGDSHGPSYVNYYKERLGWALSGYPLVVKFENLVGSRGNGDDAIKVQTVQNIAKYLNFNLSNNHLSYILDNLYNNTTRYAGAIAPKDGLDLMDGKVYKRASTGQWREFLNEENKQLLKNAIGNELIQLGYEPDLNW